MVRQFDERFMFQQGVRAICFDNVEEEKETRSIEKVCPNIVDNRRDRKRQSNSAELK